MSILGSIISSIFGNTAAVASAAGSPQGASAQSGSPAQSGGSAAPKQQVDVAGVMDKLAEESDEDLDWKKSIVDLMKLLNLDSSLTARKQLAQELHYTGDTKDSAAMNVWLHKQVMIKLTENGGQLPADMRR